MRAEDTAVVVITGYDIKQLVADDAFAILKKPFTSSVLMDTVYRAANVRALIT